MTYKTELLAKARLELFDAWSWYEDKQPGLGWRFRDKVYDCIKTIEKNPERYPERRKNYREALVKIFPYLVIYRIHKRKQTIAIVSVFHTYRSPSKKYKS